MPIVKIIQGDLLDATESVICQQSNCITTTGRGLYEKIAERYPWSDTYANRSCRSTPGSIEVNTKDGKSVVHMFAQVFPGRAKEGKNQGDGSLDRIRNFKKCLDEIDRLELGVVAMPYLIGCGLAGGEWEVYKKMLAACDTNIVLYKL